MKMETTSVNVKIKFSHDIWILGIVEVPEHLYEIVDEDCVGEFVAKALKDYEWEYII